MAGRKTEVVTGIYSQGLRPLKRRVLLLRSKNGIGLDIAFAGLPIEEDGSSKLMFDIRTQGRYLIFSKNFNWRYL
jgi:hypothetical protein